MTVSPRDSEFQEAVKLELLEARRTSPVPDLGALIEEVGDLAMALRHYREERIAWSEVVMEAVRVAVLAQRMAVEVEPSSRDLAAGYGIAWPLAMTGPLPWIISFWSIARTSDGENAYHVVQRLEISAGGVRPTREIQVAASLDQARQLIPAELRRFSRHTMDDPTIVEIWI